MNSKIKLLQKHRGVKLSSTLAGQRELIREMRNKINKLIESINDHLSEHPRGGKFGMKIW